MFLEELRAQFVDVRPQLQYQDSGQRIPGALHLDPGSGAKLTDALFTLPREKLIVAYCDEPELALSASLARRVRELGIGECCALEGGFGGWRQAGFPTEAIPAATIDGSEPPATHLVERAAGGVNLQVRAPSLSALFAQSTVGLAEVLGVPHWQAEPTEHLRVVRARDAETLLLLWMTELLQLSARERRLFNTIAIVSITPSELRARVRGVEADWLLYPPPNLLPDVRIERRGDGFEATVMLDTTLRS